MVDEAHNLAKRLSSYLSKSVNTFILERIDKEAELIKVEKLKLAKPFEKWAKTLLSSKEEMLIERKAFFDFIEKYYEIEELKVYLEELGREYVRIMGRNSYAIKFKLFLEALEETGEGDIFVLKKKEKTISLAKKSLDPSSYSSILSSSYSSILMSGTLWPIEMHKDLLGLKNVVIHSYPSPFPKESSLHIIVKGLTTRYSKRNEEMFSRYARVIDEIFSSSPGGVIVFFPSFELVERVARYLTSGFLSQKRNALPKDNERLLSLFKQKKSLLLAVQGGSLSEGIDLNKGEAKVIVLAGLGLEELTLERKAMIHYYERKFKKGWLYGYIYPAIIKALQASGRAIRKEGDKAVIIYLDERFSWSSYYSLLPEQKYVVVDLNRAGKNLISYYIKSFFGL